MAGYNGYSMSNNAVDAYADNKMPISRWTKSAILERIYEIRGEEDIDFSILTSKELKDTFLELTEWHHTSKFYNVTNFYEVNEELVLDFTLEMDNNIFYNRQRIKLTQEEVEKGRRQKEIANAIKRYMVVSGKCGNNEYYCNDKYIKSDNITIDELNEQVDKLKFLMGEYKKDTKGYKTLRGYIKNEIKKEKINGCKK